MSNISFNPMLTTNAAGSFAAQSEGYVQGQALDDPAVRYQLANGVLAATETFPMWGGVAISELIPNPGFNNVLGGNIARATSNAAITGFSVFNQGHGMVNWPQNKVPLALPSMTVPFFRFGSNARIPVACDPGLAGSLQGGAINPQVSWDINNQCLQEYDASTATISVTSMTPTYSSTTGLCTIAIVAGAASDVQAVGDMINISGAVNGGTGGNAIINGNFAVTAFTDNEHFSIQVPVSGSGVIATITGTIVLNQGTGLLAIKAVLEINVGNSKTVVWSPSLSTANWLNTGTTALILI